MMRIFLLAYWGMAIIFGLVAWFFPWSLPSDLEAAYQALPALEFTWPVIGLTIVVVAGLALHIAASIGLYKAKNAAPRMALASILLMVFAYVLVPITVFGPVEQIFNDLLFMVWGGVLALAFSPSYAEYAANKPLEPTR